MRGRLLRLVVFSFAFVLLAFPFWHAVSGQESIFSDSSVKEDPLLFEIVAPFSGDVLAGKAVLIAAPSSPDSIVRASVRLVEGLRVSAPFESVLSSEGSWSASWDTHSVPNGSYMLTFEFCDKTSCASKDVSVLVDNPPVSADSKGSSSVSSSKESAVPVSPDVGPIPISILPSNSLAALSLDARSSSFSVRSAGDPISVAPGLYDASLSFIAGPLHSIALTNVSLDSSGTLVQVSRVSFSSLIEVHDASFYPTSTFQLDFPFSAKEQAISISPEKDSRVFYCTRWDADAHSCSVTWLPATLDKSLLTFSTSASSVVVSIAQDAESTDAPLPSIFHSITPFSSPSGPLAGRASFSYHRDRTTSSSSGASLSLPHGHYEARLRFSHSGISTIDFSGLFIDHNGTLLTREDFNLLSASAFGDSLPSSLPAWVSVLALDYSSRASLFAVSPDFNSDHVSSCTKWDSVSRSCVGEWVSLDSFSVQPGLNVLGFYSPSPSTPDTDVLIPDSNTASDALVETISWLRRLHSNKRFFKADSSIVTFPALSTLFRDVEVSLECDPARAPGELIPLTPAHVAPNPPALPSSSPESVISGVSPVDSIAPSAIDVSPRPLSPIPVSPVDDFFSDSWEERLPDSLPFLQEEAQLDCDGVSLLNVFSPVGITPDGSDGSALGASPHKLKQSFSLTNHSDQAQTRLVNIRLVSSVPALVKDSSILLPSSQYNLLSAGARSVEWLRDTNRLIFVPVAASPAIYDILKEIDSIRVPDAPLSPTPLLPENLVRFVDVAGVQVGTYDWDDLSRQRVDARTVLHGRAGVLIVETIMPVSLAPGEMVFLDPTFDLSNASNFAAAWYGGAASDSLGNASDLLLSSTKFLDAGPNVQLVNVDNNAYANDLLITDSLADVNSKTNAGAVFLIRDIDSKVGANGLISSSNFSVAWNGSGANDQLGYTNISGSGVQLVNLDGNSYSNDLVLTASSGDTNVADAGIVYVIEDVDKVSGLRDLNNSNFFNVSFSGASASDFIGNTASGQGVMVVNVDNNTVANDLLIRAPNASSFGRSSNGIIYLVKDVNTLSGVKSFANTSAASVSFHGSFELDLLGNVGESSGVYLYNTDANAYANDLIIGSFAGDAAVANAGTIYLIKDIDKLSGVKDLNNTSNYQVRFNGAKATDGIARALNTDTNIFVVNMDGNASANDLVTCNSLTDLAANNVGTVHMVRDINTLSGNFDFADSTAYTARWSLSTGNDRLCETNGSGTGFQVVNIDGNTYTNDLLVTAYLANTLSRTDNGTVILFRDINKVTGDITDLNNASNFAVRIDGSRASDRLGDTNFSMGGTQLVNVDNNLVANDLLITAAFADAGASNTGVVYLIKDLNTLSGVLDLNQSAAFSARWNTTTANDGIGNTDTSGKGVQLVNVDGNSYSNDLLITGIRADINGKTDNGGIFLIKDIDKKSGVFSLSVSTNYDALWNGSANSDILGYTAHGGLSVQVFNSDLNSYANDILISDSNADVSAVDTGAVYYIRDVDKRIGTFDLNVPTSFASRWSGGSARDQLSGTFYSGSGAQFGNVDNNGYSNDLIFTAVMADVNSLTDAGAIYLIRDIVSDFTQALSFVLSLPSSGCTVGKGNITGGTSCQRGYIEATDTFILTDENQVNPEGQTTSIPFFVYDNQSNVSRDINILLDLNAALPSNYVAKAAQTYAGYAGQCSGNPNTGCIVLSTSPASVGKATYSLLGTQDLNVFIWGDFVAADVGVVDVNIDSNSISST